MDFFEAIDNRRTYYQISDEAVIPDERVKEIVDHVVMHTPSAFNSQSERTVLLFGDSHHKLWNITKDALREIVPAENFADTEARIDSFAAGRGTILFFEDNDTVEKLEKDFPLYSQNFTIWSKEASGMHQFNIWAGLEVEGYGASLQHYNELIEDKVKAEWDLPSQWTLRAQMPFGKPTGEPGEKQFKPLEERVHVFN